MKNLVVAFLFSLTISAQQEYPKDYFQSPLDIPMDLSGSFGELRSNHFHSGLDIKTNGVEGLPVYAVADGYVGRIKISTWGYGKAIYIIHPNGFTSVYAHLQKGAGDIQKAIIARQYKDKNYEVELFPLRSELQVKKGDIIGYSGNSGGSGGPHLHFEFRDTKTENIINPVFFGLNKLKPDNYAPKLANLLVYPIDSTTVNKSQRPVNLSFNKLNDGTYLSQKVEANGKIGFGINAYDFCTNPYNKNGVYKITSYLNGEEVYNVTFDTFAFSETRYINNYIDYARYEKMRQRVQKLFSLSDYPLSIIKDKNNGLFTVEHNRNYTYKIVIEDAFNNSTSISIPIDYKDEVASIPSEKKAKTYFVKASNEYNFVKDNISLYIPQNSFYNDFAFDFKVNNNTVDLEDESIPVHKHLTLTFSNLTLTADELSKTYIANKNGSSWNYNSTKLKENDLSTRIRELGTYKLVTDTEAPKIFNCNFKSGDTLYESSKIRVSISDTSSGIDAYNAYLNGEWILMEYDYKTKRLVYDLQDKKQIVGKNDLKIVITDNMQNSTTFETYFYF